MSSMVLNILFSHSFYKWIGAAVISVKLWQFASFALKEVYCRIADLCGFGFKWKDLADWAVVTGGSDGIGKAYAEELAAKGFNVCLLSRNTEKMTNVAKELEKNYQVSTKIINIDFTGGPEIYQMIDNELKDLDGDIGVLVNNVGMSYKYAEYFHAIPNGLQVMWDMINSNITSCTMMMRIVIPKMENNGVIINVSSLSALYPMPLLAAYAACKAYVDYLSRAVHYEYKGKGLTIQCVLPSYVATKMSKRRPGLEVPSAKTFVSNAIKTVGIESYTYGYFPHKIRGFVHQWLKANMPACVNFAIAFYFMRKSKEKYDRKQKRIKQELTFQQE